MGLKHAIDGSYVLHSFVHDVCVLTCKYRGQLMIENRVGRFGSFLNKNHLHFLLRLQVSGILKTNQWIGRLTWKFGMMSFHTAELFRAPTRESWAFTWVEVKLPIFVCVVKQLYSFIYLFIYLYMYMHIIIYSNRYGIFWRLVPSRKTNLTISYHLKLCHFLPCS